MPDALTLCLSGSDTEDSAALRGWLMRLLALQAERYVSCDSCSIRSETAAELLASICYSLGEYMRLSGTEARELTRLPPDDALRLCRMAVSEKTERARRLWSSVCLSAPKLTSASYTETLRSIGDFFKRYDTIYFAHLIPCDIDYQLCRPLPDELQAVSYVDAYLRSIQSENALMRAMPPGEVSALLETQCRDWRGTVLNMYEPVLTQLVGLEISGEPLTTLSIDEAARERVRQALAPLPDTKLETVLRLSGDSVGRALGIRAGASLNYLRASSGDLMPRIRSALLHGGLEGIFISVK